MHRHGERDDGTAVISDALVFGGSGYIGTHLVPFLRQRGRTVRAAGRSRAALEAKGWSDVALVEADALVPESLPAALEGVDVAYYLVHSMATGRDFPAVDRRAAANFRDAAARAGVRRIVYLGGLQPAGATSPHLSSRSETGAVLREGTVPVTELRAGIIVGPGSAAFEVIRDLVFHLPAMVTPRWVRSRAQPIALADVLEYLARLPELVETAGAIYEAGGPEILSYEDMIRIFGDIVGRHPAILPVPVLTPQLSSYWLGLVTAVPTNVARALIEGLAHDILAHDDAIRALIPLDLLPYRAAAEAALALERGTAAGQRWTDGSMVFRRNRPDFSFYGKRLSREAIADAPVESVWREVAAIGGQNGYYYLDALWRARGLIDELTGGTGLTRGRRDPRDVVAGDVIDFWRVIAAEPGQRLTLLAEMKLPGAAALDIEVESLAPARTRIRCTAHFHPAGAPGLIYWQALLPAHAVLFTGLVAAIRERAERAFATSDSRNPGPHRNVG